MIDLKPIEQPTNARDVSGNENQVRRSLSLLSLAVRPQAEY
jgi:hypothetical protein